MLTVCVDAKVQLYSMQLQLCLYRVIKNNLEHFFTRMGNYKNSHNAIFSAFQVSMTKLIKYIKKIVYFFVLFVHDVPAWTHSVRAPAGQFWTMIVINYCSKLWTCWIPFWPTYALWFGFFVHPVFVLILACRTLCSVVSVEGGRYTYLADQNVSCYSWSELPACLPLLILHNFTYLLSLFSSNYFLQCVDAVGCVM